MKHRRWSYEVLFLVVFLFSLPHLVSASTPITAWGTVITGSDETYEMVSDLSDNGVDPWGITIAAGVNKVVLLGNGYTLIGDGLSGSFEGGIRIDAAAGPVVDVRIEGFRMNGLDAGIEGIGSLCHATVRGCDLFGFTDGRAVSFRTLAAEDRIGWVVVRDNRIRAGRCLGVVFENGGNLGGAGAEMSDLSVLSNTISDLEAPSATPEPLRGAVTALAGGNRLRIRDNVILGGTDLSGVLLSSHDEEGESFGHVSITRNVVGDRTGDDGTATSVAGVKLDRVRTTSATVWSFQNNLLFFNEGDGIDNLAGSVGYTFDARRCWWGDDAGPAGIWGDGVSSGLATSPVTDLPDGLQLVASLRLAGCVGSFCLVGLYNQDQDTPGLRGFNADLQIRSTEAELTDLEEGGYLDQTGLATQYYLTGTGDERTVTGTILGGGPPLAVGNGDLFRLLFSGLQENAPTGYDGEIIDLRLRDPDNGVIPVLGLRDARITIDCTPPEILIEGTDRCGIPEITILADDYDLDEIFFRFVPGCWRLLARDQCEDGFETTILLYDFESLPDGVYEIQVCATDDAGNEATATWSYTKDTSPPPPVAGLGVAAGHNEVDLNWTPSTYPVEVVRKGWSYPEYDDDLPSPGFPADTADGVWVTTLPPGSSGYADSFTDAERNAYFYTLFHRDPCNRISPPDPGAQGVTLSYWLGDFTAGGGFGPPYDGYVGPLDLILLSGGFGTAQGDPGYDPQLDIGPTDSGYVDGIPLTDDLIDFEDVILFSIQYGVVGPAVPDAPLISPSGSPGPPRLVLEVGPGPAPDLIEVTLRLEGNRDEVKGIGARIGWNRHELRFAGAELEEGLRDLPVPVFFAALPLDSDRLDLVATPLGGGRVFAGSGPVARIALRRMGKLSDGCVTLLDGVLRDRENHALDFTSPSEGLAPPAEIAISAPRLLATVPNPVRDGTRVRFLLDRPGPCELSIYDPAGRLVRLLLRGDLPAGLHGLDWDGRVEDGRIAASGIYHCVLRTPRGEESRRIAVLR